MQILDTHVDLFMCPAVINSLMLCTSAINGPFSRWQMVNCIATDAAFVSS